MTNLGRKCYLLQDFFDFDGVFRLEMPTFLFRNEGLHLSNVTKKKQKTYETPYLALNSG